LGAVLLNFCAGIPGKNSYFFEVFFLQSVTGHVRVFTQVFADEGVPMWQFPRMSRWHVSVERAPAMESISDDRYVVYVRHDRSQSCRPDHAERPLIACSTYEQARQIQRHLHQTSRASVIRFVGQTGGGD
jgi:hypothetical protein